MSKAIFSLLVFLVIALCAAENALADEPSVDNGIYVSKPKVYDDHSLQLQLTALRSRLAQITGIDQNSITSRLGALQGGSSSQTQFGLQLGTSPTPGVTTTSLVGTPSIAQTVANSTSNTAGSVNTGSSGQSVTTTPTNTVQTATTNPSVSATPPVLPTQQALSFPTFGSSAADTLSEAIQLSYEIANLQLLLEGSLDDEYSTTNGRARKHVTIGFPISVATPDEWQYREAAAEVQISICDPTTGLTAPSLMTILPREKTYNTASIKSESASLGAGAVIGNVISVGGSFLHGHQTYYVVQAQDTVALQRKSSKAGSCGKSANVTFAWQFRPVLGQSTVHQGLRQTFAQLSLPTELSTDLELQITTVWRSFNAKTGVVGKEIGNAEAWHSSLATSFDTTKIDQLTDVDNQDGTVTVLVLGHFLDGAKIRVGDSYLDSVASGFDNNGEHIRFTAPIQSLATRGATIISPDGKEKDLLLTGPGDGPIQLSKDRNIFVPGQFPPASRLVIAGVSVESQGYGFSIPAAALPPIGPSGFPIPLPARVERPDGSTCSVQSGSRNGAGLVATATPYSDTIMEISVPLFQCAEIAPFGGPYPFIVVLGGKAFGMSDAPLNPYSGQALKFLAPKSVLQGPKSLTLKRLFLNDDYTATYTIAPQSKLGISGVVILSSQKSSTTFAVTGSGLSLGDILFPRGATDVVVSGGGTYQQFTLPSKLADEAKQIVFGLGTDPPIFVKVPEQEKSDSSTAPAKLSLDAGQPVLLGSSAVYKITGGNLQLVSTIRYLDSPLPFSRAADGKSLSLQLPNSISATVGIKPISVGLIDGSSKQFDVRVIVNVPKK